MRLFLVSLVLTSLSLLSIQSVGGEDKIVTESGVIVVGMPKENLANAGFSAEQLISDEVVGSQEYLTFFDISLVGDNITFLIEKGKVKAWFRGMDMGTLEQPGGE